MNRNLFLAILLVVFTSMLVGCGGGGGSSNPVGNSIVQSQAPDANFVRACVTPVTKRKFSFAKNSIIIHQKFREGLRAAAARIKLELLSNSNNEDITMVINSMMVQNTKGEKFYFNEEAEVQLNSNSLSALLAEKDLPEGKYNYIEFKVDSASIVENGEEYGVHIPFDKLKISGNFELKDGFETILTISFSHKLIINTQTEYNRGLELSYITYKVAYLAAKSAYEKAPNSTLLRNAMNAAKTLMDNARKAMSNKYTLVPTVKISSELKAIPIENVTDGDVTGVITNLINSDPISNVSVSIEGTAFTALTDSNGKFTFNGVPEGKYTIKATNADYLDVSSNIEVNVGQVSNVDLKMNPSIVKSTVGETGWFSEYYPLADINGAYGEVGLETPIRIDFISMGFTKAEISFNAKYHENGSARFLAYLAADQQVSAEAQIGNWWAGNTCNPGSNLGEYLATSDFGYNYKIDITQQLKENPSNIYYLAARNLDIVDIKLSDIQITVYYK